MSCSVVVCSGGQAPMIRARFHRRAPRGPASPAYIPNKLALPKFLRFDTMPSQPSRQACSNELKIIRLAVGTPSIVDLKFTVVELHFPARAALFLEHFLEPLALLLCHRSIGYRGARSED